MDILFKVRIFICSLFLIGFISGDCWAQSKSAKMPSVKACAYIASYANKGELQKILIGPKEVNSDKIFIPYGFSSDNVSMYEIDINNDGILERVFEQERWTVDSEGFSVYKLKTDEAIELMTVEATGLKDIDWSEFNSTDHKDRWDRDHAFVQYEGVNYVLGGEGLAYLLYINPKNEIQTVCEFGQREKPIQILKKSYDDNICQRVIHDQLTYVEFDKLHALSYDEVRNAGFYETGPSDKAALVDIDNDSKKELVVSLELASARRSGCYSVFLAVLTADRTSIDKSYEAKLPPSTCVGTILTPFIINGKTYLDEKQPATYANIEIYLCWIKTNSKQYVNLMQGRIIMSNERNIL
jgi:hypothetical protein